MSIVNYFKQRGLNVLSSIRAFSVLPQPVDPMSVTAQPIISEDISIDQCSKFSVPNQGILTVAAKDHDKKVAVCDLKEESDVAVRLKSLFKEFPHSSITPLLVLYHTETNQSVWSYDSHSEREKLVKIFNQSSLSFSEIMKSKGYWCDFIDPTSGMPFHGSYCNQTFSECDEDFHRLSDSLSLEDIGCCRALMHQEWGFNVFAGLLVTDAPEGIAMEVFKSIDQSMGSS